MKVKVLREVEVDVARIHVSAYVRYWEDSEVNGESDVDLYENKNATPKMPCAQKEDDEWYWCPEIDVETGKILNWEKGVTAKIHYKVCDEFACVVYDVNNEEVCDYYEYVPRFMCPQEEGYGDYIIMNINEDGFIEGLSKWGAMEFVTEAHPYAINR